MSQATEFTVPDKLPPDHGPYRPLLETLAGKAARHAELAEMMNDPEVLSDSKKLISISRESGQLASAREKFEAYVGTVNELHDLQEMIAGGDKDMAEMAEMEIDDVRAKVNTMMEDLKDAYVSAEDAGVERFFLEIRAGTGGEEAALFARDLFEMYRRYAEVKHWKFEVDDFSEAERGGFKEVIVSVSGDEAYRRLQFEGGGHRVQRVPETETQGRIHTSAVTVAVMPELPDIEIHIDMKDIEEGGCKGGGPGGQNVNKVETGWRILHKPSGLQFKITEQKSQGQNKERAWSLLRSTLYETERAKQHEEQTGLRKAMMGSGDRSQRIRTYNFPQNRCTDHRLGGGESDEDTATKNFALEKTVAGDLDPLTDALLDLDKQQRLAAL